MASPHSEGGRSSLEGARPPANGVATPAASAAAANAPSASGRALHASSGSLVRRRSSGRTARAAEQRAFAAALAADTGAAGAASEPHLPVGSTARPWQAQPNPFARRSTGRLRLGGAAGGRRAWLGLSGGGAARRTPSLSQPSRLQQPHQQRPAPLPLDLCAMPCHQGYLVASVKVPCTVEVLQLGLYSFKGSDTPMEMVRLELGSLAGRSYPAEPPGGKGARLAAATGLIAQAEVLLWRAAVKGMADVSCLPPQLRVGATGRGASAGAAATPAGGDCGGHETVALPAAPAADDMV